MAFCMNCGKQLPDGAKFCLECGAAVKESSFQGNSTAENADIEIGIAVLLNNNNDQEFTQNEVYLEHSNRTLSVKVPNWISVGQIVRLRGEGNTTRSGRKGDLLLRIDHIDFKKANDGQPIRKVDYEGEIHKCPNCGDILGAYESVCETCGWERRNSKASVAVKEFEAKYAKVDDDKKKMDLVRSFPIPNTKEDICEFVLLAAANVDLDAHGPHSDEWKIINGERRAISDAWISKMEMAIQKAELMFPGTKEYVHICTVYEKKMKQVRKKKHKLAKILLLSIGLPILLIIALVGSHHISIHTNVQDIVIEKTASDFCGQNYETVKIWLENKGFKNIKTSTEDIRFLDFEHEKYEIKSISINGQEDFTADQVFPSNATIRIVYWW